MIRRPRDRRPIPISGLPTPNPFVSGIYSYYHADDAYWAPTTPGAQAFYVPRLQDDSGNVRQINSGNNAGAPVLNTSTMTGLNSLFFDSAKLANIQVPTAQASQWTFLHDGTGCTVIAYVQPASGNAECTICNTTGTAFSQGISIYHDGVNDKFIAVVRKAGGTLILTLAGANGSAPKNVPYTVVFTYSESVAPKAHLIVISASGTRVDTSGNTSSAPSALAPAFGGLCLGRYQAANIFFLNGYIRWLLTYNRILTTQEIIDITTNPQLLSSPRAKRQMLTVGDSMTAADLYQLQMWLRSLASTTRFDRINWLGGELAGEIALFTDRQHSGYVANNIAQITTHITGQVLDFPPTDVYVMASTNDASAADPVVSDVTKAQYGTLIDTIQSQYPGATVHCARLPRRLDNATKGQWVENYATWLQNTFVPARVALGQLVDYRNGDVDNNAQISGDGVHPTNAGYAAIGDHFATADGYS